MRKVHKLELTGRRFARWFVIGKSNERGKFGQVYWDCRCDCGVERRVLGANLANGVSESCGCLALERATIHGMDRTPTHWAWAGMIQRCENPKYKFYHRYGGRGIKVCDRWRGSFAAFLEDMGPKPDGMSLDRIDNDGDYEPGNCRWASITRQLRNREVTVYLEFRGERKPLGDWADQFGIPVRRVRQRLGKGWTVEQALTTPILSKQQVAEMRWQGRRKPN